MMDYFQQQTADKSYVTPPAAATFGATKKVKPLHASMEEKFESGGKATSFLYCGDDTSSNDFEVPQYPIEEQQNRQHLEREMSIKLPAFWAQVYDRPLTSQRHDLKLDIPGAQQALEQFRKCSLPTPPTPIVDTLRDSDDMHVQFQRVNISGEDTSGVPLDNLVEASEELVKALVLREKYMSISMQSFPPLTSKFLHCVDETKTSISKFTGSSLSEKKSIEDCHLRRQVVAHNDIVS